jgi:hypothetical protein
MLAKMQSKKALKKDAVNAIIIAAPIKPASSLSLSEPDDPLKKEASLSELEFDPFE